MLCMETEAVARPGQVRPCQMRQPSEKPLMLLLGEKRNHQGVVSGGLITSHRDFRSNLSGCCVESQ